MSEPGRTAEERRQMDLLIRWCEESPEMERLVRQAIATVRWERWK